MTDHARQCWKLSSISFALLSAIYIFVPILRKPIINEDNLLEMASALMYLAVSILAVKFLLRRAQSSGRWIDWMIPSLAIFGFAEEVSVSRLFFSEAPRVEGVKVDAIHDYLRVLLNVIESGEQHVLAISIAIGVTLASLAAVFLLRRQCVILLEYEPFRFCILWFAFIGFASILDLQLISHFYMPFLEEFTETLAALSLVFAYRSLRSNLGTEASVESNISDPRCSS